MTSTYLSTDSFNEFETQIQQLWSQDYRLVDLEYVDEKWLGVFNEETNGNAYSVSKDITELN